MLRTLRNLGALLCLTLAAASAGFAQGWQHVGNVQRIEKLPDGVELIAGSAHVRVTAFRDGYFACGWRPTGIFRRIFRGR